ncbi:hypothetical protein WOLCODRAFT_138924 [Wolfiporia cocos MD-104 SS10]|uniref:MYND-type domain-containing protein n=1 Tax=Wolfiporia cocos (strain MD-104) TaxID=742152 RepID=A0A2H3JS35_WOLCO|nr:hypothetical protein WOLCODRAFT_138924 [Wolfiporia cocos MD-104 SS10]
MAHPLVFPGKYFFYPIGNTSAVCMTRDIAPEEPANVLLLGCGDPRNVLYTIFCEPDTRSRALDFTCCDFEPGVLARNVLLLTMIVDKCSSDTIWNTFFHMYLDQSSYEALVEHCKKLVAVSDNLQHWGESSYGPFIKMSTEYTLSELRRHWSLYADMQNLPPARAKAIRDAFAQLSKSTSDKYGRSNLTTARSAGPTMPKAVEVVSTQFKQYWKTGVTFTNSKQIAAAKLLNPTFAYSLRGEGCAVHYGTDPLIPFHLAPVFGNTRGNVSVASLVTAIRGQFRDWCSAFYTSVTSPDAVTPIIRFAIAEATAFCKALYQYHVARTLDAGIPIAQWKTQLIRLNGREYETGGAPVLFNVIDTSNLDDHIGLLNILIAAAPLLSLSAPSCTLYTESLLFHGEDATKEFKEKLYADITVMSLLTGLCPVDYLSGFSTRSNAHELMLYAFLQQTSSSKQTTSQFHQVTTWKPPSRGDAVASQVQLAMQTPIFDPSQLGTFLYDTYHQLFEREDAMHFFRHNQNNLLRAVAASNILHYVRESFVLLLKLVRHRLQLPNEQWLEVMDRFMNLLDEDQSLPMDTCNRQDFSSQLHRHGMYTMPFLKTRAAKIGRFSSWKTVPSLVRIIMVVPREKISVLQESVEQIGTPLLQCAVRGKQIYNIFASVHAAFGRATSMGSKSDPWVTFEEDPEGWDGTSPLVVSFTMATLFITELEPPENLRICLVVRSTPGSVLLVPKLGMDLTVFEANLMNDSTVYVLPEQPLLSKATHIQPTSTGAHSNIHGTNAIGTANPVNIELDEQCEMVASFTSRVSVESEKIRRVFAAGETPQVRQVSPCGMRLSFESCTQDVSFPFAVIGSQHRLRLARKSLYIEIVVPAYGPFKAEGMKLNPFPMVRTDGPFNLFSIHRANLDRMPILDMKAQKLDEWLNPHLGSMMSKRERSLRKHEQDDTMMHIKDSLHTILVRSSGIQGGPPMRLLCLRDKATNNCDTVIFIADLRFDLQCHTVACDGYVLPLTHDLLRRIEAPFSKLVTTGQMLNVLMFNEEVTAWKQLLPALAERCRYSWSHGPNCEYKAQGNVPLTTDMENNPLCNCGMGKNVEGMDKENLWRPFSPYVTRIALSPLFAVSYLEPVGRDPSLHRCYVCRGKGKPKIRTCSGCKKIRYCSEVCQRKHWPAHKPKCKA